MVQRIPHNPDILAAYCRKHHIRRLAFFGSVLRDDFDNQSDIDVLVEFEPGSRVGYFDLAQMEIELAKVLNTPRKIDLRTAGELSRYFRDEVVDQAEVLHDSAACSCSAATHARRR